MTSGGTHLDDAVPGASAIVPASSAIEQALGLFEPSRQPTEVDVEHGYLDLLGGRDPTGAHLGQQLMLSRLLPLVYQRLWRPLGSRLLMGIAGPGSREEHRNALAKLSISPGDRVLDVACGPGNFVRTFAPAASEGLSVGLDASETMLAVAVRETESANVAYVRGDACELPFRDGSFDAISCFAALYLIEDPQRALDEIVRVLTPGGRVALLSSCHRGLLPARTTNAVVRGLSGVRIFARDELTRALVDRGLVGVEQHVTGFAQLCQDASGHERIAPSQMSQRIAVIGGGAAGLTAGYLLRRGFELTLFEKESRLGGNAYTYTLRPTDSNSISLSPRSAEPATSTSSVSSRSRAWPSRLSRSTRLKPRK
jgi:SAM-dependent methyltransferase